MDDISSVSTAAPLPRHKTVAVDVGGVTVGGGAPIVVQSMTNTDTADIEGTVAQIAALSRAGSELVRITVDRDEAAAAVPRIKEAMEAGWQGDQYPGGALHAAPLAGTYFNMRKTTIYGGSNEVQRTIVAQTVLG